MNSKKIIIIVVVLVLGVVVVYNSFIKKNGKQLTTAKVTVGNVVKEVTETGQIKKGDMIKLGFKSSGTIQNIDVSVGDSVKKDDVLASLDKSELNIHAADAQAAVDLAQAEYNKLLAGASQQDIQIAQTNLQNAKTALTNAQKALQDIEDQGQQSLQSDYEDALNVLDDSYIEISNAKNKADAIKNSYFVLNDQEGVNVRAGVDTIIAALSSVKTYVDTAKVSGSQSDIDTALSQMKSALQKTSDALDVIGQMVDSSKYKDSVSATDKAALNTERDSINTVLTSTVNSQQTISATKITNSSNINTYQTSVDAAQGSVNSYQDQLNKLIAPPRQEDIDLYKAKLSQAKSNLQLLQKQIQDATLRSPVDGVVAAVNNREGEGRNIYFTFRSLSG